MTYTLNIVMNDRNWYDSRIAENDAVVYQNVNYGTGVDHQRSVNVVRQRYLEDWSRRVIPNSVRQGIGLSDPAGASDQIGVTQGYAIVGGRFIEVPAGTFDASDEFLTPGEYYLVIRVAAFSEGDTRDPTAGTAALVGKPIADAKSHNDLVIAKFNYTGTVINNFEDYTATQEWQASVISPVSVKPGLTTGDTSILLRAGDNERVDNLGIETTTTRFYLSSTFKDQTASDDILFINNSGIMETRDDTDSVYKGHDMLNLLIGGTEIITSAGNINNVTTINTQTLGDNTANSFVMRTATQTLTNKTLSTPVIATLYQDASLTNLITFPASNQTLIGRTTTDTLTNKTLTSPIITGGTLNGGTALTVTSTELNQIADGYVRGGTSTGDIVTIDGSQTLSNKKLTTLTVRDLSNSWDLAFTMPTTSAARAFTIASTVDDEFVMKTQTQTLTNKSISEDQITGNLAVARGGTGIGSITQYGVMVANSTSAMTTVTDSIGSKLLVSQSTANPSWQTPTITLTGEATGSGSMNSSGDWSITTSLNPNEIQFVKQTISPATYCAGDINGTDLSTNREGALTVLTSQDGWIHIPSFKGRLRKVTCYVSSVTGSSHDFLLAHITASGTRTVVSTVLDFSTTGTKTLFNSTYTTNEGDYYIIEAIYGSSGSFTIQSISVVYEIDLDDTI